MRRDTMHRRPTLPLSLLVSTLCLHLHAYAECEGGGGRAGQVCAAHPGRSCYEPGTRAETGTDGEGNQHTRSTPLGLCLRGGGSTPPARPPATGCVAVDDIDCCAPSPEYPGQGRELVWKERAVPPWAAGSDGGPVCARVLDLRPGPGTEHLQCKPRGCAVVIDPTRVHIAPLWNEEVLEPNFPRWQDGSEIDEDEYRRCGEAGYPFHVWLRKLLPTGSTVWRPSTAQHSGVAADPADLASPTAPAAGDLAVPAQGSRGAQDAQDDAATAVLRIGGLLRGAARQKAAIAAKSASRRRSRCARVAGKRGGGADGEGPEAQLVMACNSVQSNFMAPYDFLIIDGVVVRQGYTKVERPLTGTSCWVFQTSGAGPPRILCVQLGDEDAIWHQAEAAALQREGGRAWGDVSVSTGLSGLPILLDGSNVCAAINQVRLAHADIQVLRLLRL
jgi:hypothetical protein